MRIELRPLTPEDGPDIYDMLQEMPSDENGFMNGVRGKTYEEYRAWLEKCDRMARGEGLEDRMVPQDVYWLYIDGIPVGMGKLRHCLTDKLREEGGHIGYAIRPSQRGKGYGRLLLRLLLEPARALGIGRVLITVRNHNAASVRVSLANGGVIERVGAERHYIWIDL